MNNKPVYTFDKEHHLHFINGVQVPGPTTVFKAEGYINYPDTPGMKDAMHRGSYVHHACHLLNHNDLDENSVASEYAGYIEAYKILLKDLHMPTVEASEEHVYSSTWMYAGILDHISGDILADIKTSKQSSFWWPWQTAAYALAWKEMTGKTIKKRIIIKLSAEGTYKIEEHKDKTDERTFLSILGNYKLKLKHGVYKLQGEDDDE